MGDKREIAIPARRGIYPFLSVDHLLRRQEEEGLYNTPPRLLARCGRVGMYANNN